MTDSNSVMMELWLRRPPAQFCGTNSQYQMGCRCAGCRRAHSIAQKRWRNRENLAAAKKRLSRQLHVLAEEQRP